MVSCRNYVILFYGIYGFAEAARKKADLARSVAIGDNASAIGAIVKAACPTPSELHGDSLQTYMAWLDEPPCEAVAAANTLTAKADALAATLKGEDLKTLGDVDVVVAGSSYLDRYYVGFEMVLSRMKDIVNVRRISGASSGADAPFDMLLMGELAALKKFLSFGLVGSHWNYVYFGGVSDQSYYFKGAEWMIKKYGSKLPHLDDYLYVWTNCKWHCPWFDSNCNSSVAVSHFDNATQSERAYIATGSVFPPVDINETLRRCTDGGVGHVFKDHRDAQITVSPTKALGYVKAMRGYTLEEYFDGVRMGQDAAVEFLRTGTVAAGAPGHKPVSMCTRERDDCPDPEI